MSRKSVPFSMPEGAARPGGADPRRRKPEVIDAETDEWVSDRNSGVKDSAPSPSDPGYVVDLSAERSLKDIAVLTVLTPIALGWFYLVNTMRKRM